MSEALEGRLEGLFVGLAVLVSLYLSHKKDVVDEKWFTKLDQKRRRSKRRSKWYYWLCAAFMVLLILTVTIFVAYQILMIAEVFWNAK